MGSIRPQTIDQDNGAINQILHDDALRLVFDALSSPPGFLRISTQAMLERPWTLRIRTFKVIVLVCKRWYTLAIRHLYDEICLRYAGQIPALVRTIRTAPQAFAPLVHNLRIICYIPDEYMRVCAKGLQYLFDTCSSLQEVAFEETAATERTILTLGGMLGGEFPRLLSSTQKFSLFTVWTDLREDSPVDCYAAPIPLKLVSTLPSLVSLGLHGFPRAERDVISLPFLSSLRIYTSTTFYLPDTWTLPSLVDLSIRTRMEGPQAGPTMPGKGIGACANTREFFNAHGKKLIRVDLGYSRMDWNTVTIIVDRCPQLHHFVFTIPLNKSLNVDPIRKLPFVDIFKPPFAKPVAVREAREMLCETENIRLLDRALLSFVPDIPTLVSPEESLELRHKNVKIETAFKQYGLTIMHSDNAVWMATLLPDDEVSHPFRDWSNNDDATDQDEESESSEDTEEELELESTWSDDLDSDVETDTSNVSDNSSFGDEGDSASETEDEDETELRVEVQEMLADDVRHRMQFNADRVQQSDFQNMQIDEQEALRRFAETIQDE